MSYIPNCRPQYKKDAGPFPYERTEEIPEDAINPYWYGLLNGEDKEFVKGFDYCIENAVNNLFDNLDVYASELGELGVDVNDIDIDVVNGANDDTNIFLSHIGDDRPCRWYPQYTESELSAMSKATRLMLLLKYMVNHYVEMSRDELVTSLIENMNEKEYGEAVKRVSVD